MNSSRPSLIAKSSLQSACLGFRVQGLGFRASPLRCHARLAILVYMLLGSEYTSGFP